MTPFEKWSLKLDIIQDFEDNLISEKEFEEKLFEFESKYVDGEFIQYLLDNIYTKDGKTRRYYLNKLKNIKKLQ